MTNIPHTASRGNLGLTHFMWAIAKAVVASQVQLDAAGLDALDDWDQSGIPPIFRAWTVCRFASPVAFNSNPKKLPDGQTFLSLEPTTEGIAHLKFAIQYHLLPQLTQED